MQLKSLFPSNSFKYRKKGSTEEASFAPATRDGRRFRKISTGFREKRRPSIVRENNCERSALRCGSTSTECGSRRASRLGIARDLFEFHNLSRSAAPVVTSIELIHLGWITLHGQSPLPGP